MIYIYLKKAETEAYSPAEKRKEESRLARELLFEAIKEALSLPPAEIKRNEYGKPYFDCERYPAFSISHTAGLVAVAFSPDADSVGADIERRSERLSDFRLVDRFFGGLCFSANELEDIKIIWIVIL